MKKTQKIIKLDIGKIVLYIMITIILMGFTIYGYVIYNLPSIP